MNILIIGSGAREHALAWKISKSPILKNLYLWPGNAASLNLGKALDLPPSASYEDLAEAVKHANISAVICGPEQPLESGLANILKKHSIPVFGPQKEAALLESSKEFAKTVMAEAGINTASFNIAKTQESCRMQAFSCLEKTGGAVLKASGLASGKGVFLCYSKEDVENALETLYAPQMQKASEVVVIEEILKGRECSYFTLIGQNKSQGLGFAVDFKRLADDDAGPNTGGMGCYTPVPWLPTNAAKRVEAEIVEPLLKTLRKRDIEYTGWLYVGLMWGESGPSVVEFNVRLGDPEAQILAVADERDWLQLILQKLNIEAPIEVNQGDYHPNKKVVGVVMASEDYPYGGKNTQESKLPQWVFEDTPQGGMTFAAAVKTDGNNILTASGRVLTVVSQGESFHDARTNAYEMVQKIATVFKTSRYRNDIALKVTKEEETNG